MDDEIYIGERSVQGGTPRAAYITIPVFCLRHLGIKPGTSMRVTVKGKALVYTPISESETSNGKDEQENGPNEVDGANRKNDGGETG